MKKIPIHPAADVFPMMPNDELQELAADIKENGLRESLKISNGQLIDGRNRMAACQIAGVEPTFEQLNGNIDPVAYIFSENVKRRHMTKGQQAIAVAMIYPEPMTRAETGERKGKRCKLNIPFSKQLLSCARTVIAVLPELAKQVLDGIVSLSEAYERALAERKAQASAKTSDQYLRQNAPDLADLVDEDRMQRTEALALVEQRKHDEAERQKNQRETMIRLGEQAYNSTVAWSVESFWKSVEEAFSDQDFRDAFLARLRLESNLSDIEKGAKIFSRLLIKLTKKGKR